MWAASGKNGAQSSGPGTAISRHHGAENSASRNTPPVRRRKRRNIGQGVDPPLLLDRRSPPFPAFRSRNSGAPVIQLAETRAYNADVLHRCRPRRQLAPSNTASTAPRNRAARFHRLAALRMDTTRRIQMPNVLDANPGATQMSTASTCWFQARSCAVPQSDVSAGDVLRSAYLPVAPTCNVETWPPSPQLAYRGQLGRPLRSRDYLAARLVDQTQGENDGNSFPGSKPISCKVAVRALYAYGANGR